MELTKEQLEKAKQAKTAEELLAFAKENGIELTEEKAKQFFAQLHKDGEIADDELDNVSGGGLCESYERPRTVQMAYAEDGAVVCPQCKGGLDYGTYQRDPNGDEFDPASCYHCQLNFRHYWIGNSWTEA